MLTIFGFRRDNQGQVRRCGHVAPRHRVAPVRPRALARACAPSRPRARLCALVPSRTRARLRALTLSRAPARPRARLCAIAPSRIAHETPHALSPARPRANVSEIRPSRPCALAPACTRPSAHVYPRTRAPARSRACAHASAPRPLVLEPVFLCARAPAHVWPCQRTATCVTTWRIALTPSQEPRVHCQCR